MAEKNGGFFIGGFVTTVMSSLHLMNSIECMLQTAPESHNSIANAHEVFKIRLIPVPNGRIFRVFAALERGFYSRNEEDNSVL